MKPTCYTITSNLIEEKNEGFFPQKKEGFSVKAMNDFQIFNKRSVPTTKHNKDSFDRWLGPVFNSATVHLFFLRFAYSPTEKEIREIAVVIMANAKVV